jgi:hypothetical protein
LASAFSLIFSKIRRRRQNSIRTVRRFLYHLRRRALLRLLFLHT